MEPSSASDQVSNIRPTFRVTLASAKGPGLGRATLSRRANAQALRQDIDVHLASGELVELDCAGTDATQSFMDELVGILVLERGPSVLNLLRFRGCSADMKAIINFVVSDRAAQHLKNPHFHAPR